MPKGRKTGGKDFVKGDPRAGRPATTPEVKAARQMTRDVFKAILAKFLEMTQDELNAHIEKADTPVVELIVGGVMVQAAKGGDQARLDFLMNHLLGKPPTEHRLTGADGGAIRIAREDPASWTDEQLATAKARLKELNDRKRS